MDLSKLIELLAQREKEVKAGGGGQAGIEKQHALGKLTARERLNLLLDEGSFFELDVYGQHQCHDFGLDKTRPWGDGVITGYGEIDQRPVFIFSEDFTSLGGSAGPVHITKICRIIRKAREKGVPVIGLYDSVGARIQEGVNLTGYASLFHENTLTSGTVPQISVILGNCAGGAVYSPGITDFVFVVEGISRMFITGPNVIREATGEEVSMEKLGGAQVHSRVSGVADFIAGSEAECFQQAKKLLGFLPANYAQEPPRIPPTDDPGRREEGLEGLVPGNPLEPFDIHEIISRIVDHGDFLEAKAGFAQNIVTGFARLNGYPVGIVANQPLFLAGALDCDASMKAARFVRFCDAFNIPLVTLVDTPGYLPGVEEEYKGIIRHGAKLLFAYAEATVPKITCFLRKAYGGGYAAMCCRNLEADAVLAWPTARIALVGAEGAVKVLYRAELAQAKNKEAFLTERIKEYEEKFNPPYYAASKLCIDKIIRPKETRPQLIEALKMLLGKKEQTPPKKHSNIPL